MTLDIRRHPMGWARDEETVCEAAGHRTVFKALKESHRLGRHRLRGLRQVTLHSPMSVVTFPFAAFKSLIAGKTAEMTCMVSRIS